MKEEKVPEIYKYIDLKGIPVSLLSSYTIDINIEENPYEETYIEKGVKITSKHGSDKLEFNLPFNLTQNEQEEIVILKNLKQKQGKVT